MRLPESMRFLVLALWRFPVGTKRVIVVKRPPRAIGLMEFHTFLRHVEVRPEVLFRDVERGHPLKLARKGIADSSGQLVGFCKSRFNQDSQPFHNFGTLDREAALGSYVRNLP